MVTGCRVGRPPATRLAWRTAPRQLWPSGRCLRRSRLCDWHMPALAGLSAQPRVCVLLPAVQDGAGLLPAYRGAVDAVRQIVRQEGWRALYSGGCVRGCVRGWALTVAELTCLFHTARMNPPASRPDPRSGRQWPCLGSLFLCIQPSQGALPAAGRSSSSRAGWAGWPGWGAAQAVAGYAPAEWHRGRSDCMPAD